MISAIFTVDHSLRYAMFVLTDSEDEMKKYLKQYVDQKNVWNRITNRPLMDYERLGRDEIRYLIDCIEGDLSPENLTCDGELRGEGLHRKQRMLLGARVELERL